MTYQAHTCATYGVVTGVCPGCGAPRLHCALCGADATSHQLDPCVSR
ncbi:hypothetical protein [Ornithinimicrobium avium]|nr:hypothetical protein [Ornithinimicrobium avium]